MSRTRFLVMILVAFMATGIGGYWIGRHSVPSPALAVATESARMPSGPIIYYQDPDGKPFYSLEPKQTADGRAYRAVLATEDVSFDGQAKPATEIASDEAKGRRILYYRNPMGLPDVSKTPKKDSMGMDYIAVYEGDDEEGSSVKVSPGKLQRIGVNSERAILRIISEPVRAPGTIQNDERQVAVIAMRAEAFIDRVENITTGSEVREGQPLMQVYSPAISLAASDYVSVLNMHTDSDRALRGARQKLINLGVPESVVTEIARTRQVPLTFTWTAPRDGVVVERNVVDGMRVTPGQELFRLADHSVVWAMVDVAERDLGVVTEGQPVAVRVRSYPGRIFAGKIALVYPHLNPSTRTVSVRIELPNPDHLLLPDMYAEAEIDTGTGEPVLAAPDSAVIDSGDRQIVIVDKGDGRFEPRPVHIGRRGAGYVEIRDGVKDGESVVTSANFLIDAESNLKAALRGLSDAGAPQ
jgi:membrane fusion protein, copper/silver efflux system